MAASRRPSESRRERGVSTARDRPPGWPAVLLSLLASHLAGDVLMQTEWQAVNKAGGLRETRSRKALLAHVSAYTASFLPALVWIGRRTSVQRAAVVGGAVAIPHLLVDDGRLVPGPAAGDKHAEGAAHAGSRWVGAGREGLARGS